MALPKKFEASLDKTPKYTVKEVADMMGLSVYAVRYYENSGLVPEVDRSAGNIRMFSDYNVSWLRLVHCLRATGLSIDGVRRYVRMCLEGDSTIPQRAEIIFNQEKILREQLETLQQQMEVLKYKKDYYTKLLAARQEDLRGPTDRAEESEPVIVPKDKKQNANEKKK